MKLCLGLLCFAAWMNAEVIPHIAVGGSFTTEFLVSNPTSTTGSVTVSFYDDNGKAMAVNLPSLNGTSTGFRAASIPSGGSVDVVAADPNGPTRGGSAVVTASNGLITQAIFRSHASDGNFYEASVPASQGTARFAVPFDATVFAERGWQIITGIAITNLDAAQPARITCTATSDAGVAIANAVTVPSLAPLGHWADYNFPALAGKRGLLDCSSNTSVAAIGLRFLGSYAFSSLTVTALSAAAGSTAPNTVDKPEFSFAYPAGWKVSTPNDNSASASDPVTLRSISVVFLPGVPNTAHTFNQCASESDILTNYYQKNFVPYATSTGQYPYTTVTNDGFQPGQLGGVSTWISVVHDDAYSVSSQLTYVDVVPREGGMYIVQYQHQSEPEAVSEPIRQAFLKSIVFKSAGLDQNAYCNYLGN